MSDRLDRMRAKQPGSTRPPEAPSPKVPPRPRKEPPQGGTGAVPAAKQPRGKPPDEVLYACGHKDSNRLCPTCKIAAKRAKNQRRSTQRTLPGNLPSEHGRLPDDSAFVVIYDAEACLWRGCLRLVSGQEFAGEASGVFRLLRKLDIAYRATLTTEPDATAEPPPG